MKNVTKFLRSCVTMVFVAVLVFSSGLGSLRIKAATAIPTDLTVTYSVYDIYRFSTVKWSAVTNATAYRVYRSLTEDGPYTSVYQGKTREFSEDFEMQDPNMAISANDVYYYKVSALVGNVESGLSAAVCNRPEYAQTGTTLAGGVGAFSMINLVATASQRADIVITWEYTDPYDYFEVYRSDTEDGVYEMLITGIDEPYYRNSGLVEKATYYFKVVIVYNGTETTYGPVSAATHGELGQPSNLAAVSTGTSTVTVTWDAATGADFYEVYRSNTVDGTYEMIAGPIAETAYYDTGLTAHTTYYYQIRAVQECETCNFIGPVAVTTQKVWIKPGDYTLRTNKVCCTYSIHGPLIALGTTKIPEELDSYEIWQASTTTNYGYYPPGNLYWSNVFTKKANSTNIKYDNYGRFGSGLYGVGFYMPGSSRQNYYWKYRFKYKDGTYSEWSRFVFRSASLAIGAHGH